MYLDRYFVKLQSVDPLHPKGICIFKEFVFERSKGETTTAVLKVVEDERKGENIDLDLLKSVVDMYIDLGIGKVNVYVTEFEEAFLNGTTDFYCRQAAGWITDLSFPEFLLRAEQAIEAEDKRVEAYLHRSTAPKLKHAVIQAVLAGPQDRLLEKTTAVTYLLENDKREDLARMHRMFGLVSGGLNPIATSFRQFVQARGQALVEVQADQFKNMSKSEAMADTKFIQSLLDLHDKFKSIVTECFDHDSLFQKAMKEAFEVFINREISSRYSFAMLMASFCDRILKKRKDALAEDEIEKLLYAFSILIITSKCFFSSSINVIFRPILLFNHDQIVLFQIITGVKLWSCFRSSPTRISSWKSTATCTLSFLFFIKIINFQCAKHFEWFVFREFI